MNFVNNWIRPIELAIGATSAALDLPDGLYRLTLSDSASAAEATRWEYIDAEVAEGAASLARGLEGTEDQEWGEGSVIYCSVTAATMAALAAASDSGGDGLTKANFVELIPQGYLGSAASNEAGAVQVFNRKALGCLFYGALKSYIGSAPIYRVGAGPDVVFGTYQRWSLGAAECTHVYTVVEASQPVTIGLAPPAAEFGSLSLAAPALGPIYDERPAQSFELLCELTVPALAAGAALSVSFKVAGYSEVLLELDPTTRMWSINGMPLAAQPTYGAEVKIFGSSSDAMVSIDGTAYPVSLSTDAYAASSGIRVQLRSAAPSVCRIGRLGGHVIYADYA